jgi:tripartite-type tricarboxylate transporter receptor subunit TctC
MQRFRLGLGLVLVMIAAAWPARAQEAWPQRPLRLVVPYPPGGVTDGFGRLAAEWLAPRLGQPVVVENRSGASGALAIEYVMASRADGYTLLVSSNSQLVFQQVAGRPSYEPLRDLAPISIMGRNPAVLAVRADLGVTTLPAFVALLRQSPGKYDYSSAGAGGASHLAMVLFTQVTGTSMQHVPYRGGVPAMQDLLAGVVAAHAAAPSDALPHVTGGRIRLLAVTGDKRLPAAPEVPTTAELGYPQMTLFMWNSLLAPLGTPAPVLARLEREIRAACGDAVFQAGLARLGAEPVCGSSAEMATTLRTETPMWREVVRASGLTFD